MTVQTPIDLLLRTMTLRQKVSGLFILHVTGTNLAVLRDFLRTYQPAGLIFMGDNIPEDNMCLRELTKGLQNQELPYFFAVDEEGGLVARLTSDTYQSAAQLKYQPSVDTGIAFTRRTKLLHHLGLNVNFGIVADLNDDSASFIYPRTFGADTQAVSERVAIAVVATTRGTLSVLKHFPGHGETMEDSHEALPVVTLSKTAWRNRTSLPFSSGIAAGADMLMFGHLIYDSVDSRPASLSSVWHLVARDDLGFHGLSVTDDMIMLALSDNPVYYDHVANAIAALRAGNDLLLFVTDYGWAESRLDIDALIEGVVKAVKNGELNEELVDRSIGRVLAARRLLVDI